MRITTFFFFMFFLLSCLPASAANYYIDNNAGNDNNSGLTPELSIKTIAQLSSKVLAPGDNIFFARGSVWKEQFNINYSGTSSAPITISAYGTGNLPKIDAELVRANGIYIYGKSYITVKNINVENQASVGGIRIKSCSNIVVDSCVFYVTHQGGVFIENSTKCLISNNTMTTPSTAYNTQTDGIYSQRNSNITFDGNNILITNQQVEQHIDGIQSYLDTNMTFCNNKIEQRNTKTYNAQGIYATTGSGNFLAFNNVVICPNSQSNTLACDNLSTGTASLEAYNNTLINGGYNCLMAKVINLSAKNNIFKSSGNYAVINIASTVNPVQFNYNIYFNTGSSSTNMVYYQGSNRTFTQWKSMGCEVNGKYSNPALNSDCSINQSSPAVDAGTLINSSFNVDIIGTVRPQLNAIDVGAYEFKSISVPVELVSFTGTLSGKQIMLKWRTASEINNYGFDVERNNGNGWVKVGFVAGAGNSNTIKDYLYSDKYTGRSDISYRLKQIDLNGSYTYSNVIVISKKSQTYFMSENYPNPFNPSTTVRYSVPNNSSIKIAVFNITGEQVSSLVDEVKAAGDYEVSWNAGDMASGIYLIKISAADVNGEGVYSKVLKINLVK